MGFQLLRNCILVISYEMFKLKALTEVRAQMRDQTNLMVKTGSNGASNFSTPSFTVLKKTCCSVATSFLLPKKSFKTFSATSFAVPLRQLESEESLPILSSRNFTSLSWSSNIQRTRARPFSSQTTLRLPKKTLILMESSMSSEIEVLKRIEFPLSLFNTLSPSFQMPTTLSVRVNSRPSLRMDCFRPMWKRPSPEVTLNVNPAILKYFACRLPTFAQVR